MRGVKPEIGNLPQPLARGQCLPPAGLLASKRQESVWIDRSPVVPTTYLDAPSSRPKWAEAG